jgi:hypothetical protein
MQGAESWFISQARWHRHLIERYAQHNGHVGLIRERIDGVTGD